MGSGMGDSMSLETPRDFSGFITNDPQLIQILQMTEKIAATEASVLIHGESGTGKELVSKRIHALSRRKEKSLVSINCGAIQETLLLSELFGHEKGAFTGAVAQKKGLAELAHEGTLFLDEIGEMGMEAQSKLLRFLQEGEIYRVGGTAPIKVNVRIVSATNKDLEAQVKAGKFREDLFYRINTVSVRIPPLRNRPGDIPLLIEKFLAAGTPSQLKGISPKALELLVRYPWPGNVRELQNTIERFKILVDSELVVESDIPLNMRASHRETEFYDFSSGFLLAQVEKKHILRVLAHFKGNKTKAANAMGITVKTLYNKLAQYDEDRSQEMSDHPTAVFAPQSLH